MSMRHTANRQLGTAGDELKIAAASEGVIFRHDLNQVLDRLAVRVESVVCLKCLDQC